MTFHEAEDAKAATICVEVIEPGLVTAIDDTVGDIRVDRSPVPIDRRETVVHFAGTNIVIGNAPFALGLGDIGHGRGVCPGQHNLGTRIKEGCGAIFFSDRIVPCVDPTNVHCAIRTGLSDTQHKGISEAKFFGDREGCHVTEFGVAIHFCARTCQHAGQVLHVFHRTEQITKICAIGFVSAHVNERDVWELAGHGLHGVYVAERCAKDQVETLAGEAAEDLF